MASKPETVRMTQERKRSLMTLIASLELDQMYRVLIEKCRPRRTNSQLRYYFGGYVKPFADWLVENWGGDGLPASEAERILFAHELLKRRHIECESVKLRGRHGVVEKFTVTPSTKGMDTLRFTTYLDDCRPWLEEFCGIVVLTPEEWAMTGGGDDEYSAVPRF